MRERWQAVGSYLDRLRPLMLRGLRVGFEVGRGRVLVD